jgi:glycosyltransferase involved in cell wall biosynthesis
VFVHRGLKSGSEDLINLYQSADIFVLPTFADGLPSAAIEAASTGLPIIASGIGGLPDIVESGRTGYLIEPGDRQGLAGALRELIDNPHIARGLGRAGRARAVERFDARTNAGRIIDLAQTVHQTFRR